MKKARSISWHIFPFLSFCLPFFTRYTYFPLFLQNPIAYIQINTQYYNYRLFSERELCDTHLLASYHVKVPQISREIILSQ